MTTTFKFHAIHSLRVCGAALALILAAPAAFGQITQYHNMFSAGIGYNTPGLAYASLVQQQMQQNAYFQSQMGAKTQPAPSFTPVSKRSTPEQFTANVKTPQERAQVIDMCRTILQTLEAQPGVRKNNLSTALTVLMGIGLQVSTGREFSDAESEGLQRTINDVLADTPALKVMSNDKRTAAYDAFMITGGLIAAMAQNAAESGNAVDLEQAKDLSKQSLAMFMR